jgi:prepilin-type N-terminal cleavage/methylation domain-containing protein
MTLSCRRSGFTLIELLVVLGFLLFLGAVLAPAVQKIRQAAARTQAQNNLHQIGIAVDNYHATWGNFPPTVNRDESVFYRLLPFIEQGPLTERGPVWEAGTMGEVIPLYLDPRDDTAPGNKYDNWLATTNFAANWLVFKTGKMRFADITDGTQSTIMFSERYQICNGQPNAWAYDRLYYWAPMFAYYSTAKFQMKPTPSECDPALAQALDFSGVLTCFADGSTRTIEDGVGHRTWHALLTPDGNEAFDDD